MQLACCRKPLGHIPDSRQIQGSRLDVQFLKNSVLSRVMMQTIHTTRLIIQIPKDNRAGGTCILTSRPDVSIVNLAISLGSCIDLAVLNSLDAIRAFFHHPSSTNRYLRIQNQRLKLLGSLLSLVLPSVEITVLVVVIEVIESPNFIRTVVGTISSSNTTIISHRIDALLGVHSGCNRTNLLARGRFAVSTCHRLHHNLRIKRLMDASL